MTGRMMLLFGAAIALGLAVAGCGGGESDASSGSITKAQFLKRANAICYEERKDVGARVAEYQLSEPKGLSPGEARIRGVQEVLLPIFERELRRVRGLGLPEGEEKRINSMLTDQRHAINYVAGLREVEPVENGWEKYFSRPTRFMHAYGLNECTVR